MRTIQTFKTICVDFDGTLCEDRFPEIGEARWDTIRYIRDQARKGSKIILYTCRENGTVRPLLDEAVKFCERHKIPIYAVNENPDNPYQAEYGTGTARKVYADVYIDDKAMHPELIGITTRMLRKGRKEESQ